MSKIAVLTDSSSDIPQALAEKYGIDILNFTINLDGTEYEERKDVGFEDFYGLMRAAKGVPNTAALTPMQIAEQYCHYVDEDYTDVLQVCINSTGSSTYNNCKMALNMLREERPEHHLRVHLVDSHTYSMTFGWYVCEAARKLRNGAELRPVIAELEHIFDRMELVLAAYSLKQMKKSGRVSAAAAFAGELLGLRPIISLISGKSVVENKVRGDASVPPAMIKYIKSRVSDLRNLEYCVGYTDCDDALETLLKLCKKEFGHPPLYVFRLGGVVSANTGPDAIAITYLGRPRNL